MTARWKRATPAPASSDGTPVHLPATGPLADPTIRRILELAGFDPRPDPPSPGAAVAVWGSDPNPSQDALVLRVHPALPFTPHPGWAEPPAGLIIAPLGSPLTTGRIESILRDDPLDDAALMQHAIWGIARLKRLEITKSNNSATDPLPEPGYVLILDQTPGDPATRQGGTNAATFRDMLNAAIDDFPHARIVILLDPQAKGRHHFRDMDFGPRVTYLDAPASIPALLEGASAVYAVSSPLGFDAIMAGHRPKVFGQPFYAGWGLTDDTTPIPRRGRKLSRAQLFAVAMILAPVWYDPCRDRLCTFEEALDGFEARLRLWNEDHPGYIALGMDRREHRALNRFFGRLQPLEFGAAPDAVRHPQLETGRKVLARPQARVDGAICVEDGFLRPRRRDSPAVSMIADDLGIYHDPSRPSRLEHLIAAPCPPDAEARAERVIRHMVTKRLSLAAPGSPLGALPAGHRILVAGDRDDDATTLLSACRAANPDAVLIFLPDPQATKSATRQAARLADHLAQGADPILLIDEVNEVWTNTSTLGFDALLRRKPVTCLGQPFYAGWGLTRDLAPKLDRRTARPTLAHLVHAALIAYPRYIDNISGLPCSVEVIIERLSSETPQGHRFENLLSLFRGNRR